MRLQTRFMSLNAARAPDSGFTILEVTMAIGVLAIALVGAVQLFVYCLWEAENAGNVTVAISQCHAKLEEMRDAEFADLPALYGAGGMPGPRFTPDRVQGKGVIYLTSLDADHTKIDVVVSWRERTGAYGEDTNLNGLLDAGEDVNGNGRIDSPASLSTLRTRR